jgi:hypothetical protein
MVCLAHSKTGGGTSGRWSFFIWYLPSCSWCEPQVWEPRGGTPLLCCVNNHVHAVPYRGQCPTRVAGEQVVWADGFVIDYGLFLASDSSALVLVELSGSPTGYGSWRLSARELGDLWDVPILFLDSLLESEVTSLMKDICMSPPSHLMHTGGGVLLTTGFRGGLDGWAPSGLELPGPRPRMDDDLGLLPKAKQQRRELLLALRAAAAEAGFALSIELIRGDSQKVDNASVPNHLWLWAFALGYGNATCLARHLDALNITGDNSGCLLHKDHLAGWRGALLGFRVFAGR